MSTGIITHPVEDAVRGLVGRVFHDDFVSRVVKIEPLGRGLERISCELTYDPAFRRGRHTRPFPVSIIAPSGLLDYRAYHAVVLDRMKRAASLIDVQLPGRRPTR